MTERILERLLAGQEQMMVEMKIEMKTNQERINAMIEARIEASNEKCEVLRCILVSRIAIH
jgi:hypothetical protein